MKVLIIGSDNPWRMEAAVERALPRAGHVPRLFDDRRMRRLVGFRLTQVVTRQVYRRFRPDFVILSKCHGLSLETVAYLVRDVPSAMWYHDRTQNTAEVARIASVARLAGTFFVTGWADEWRAHGLKVRFLPAAGAREIVPVAPSPRFAADASFIGTGYDEERARFLVELSRDVRVRVWGPAWTAWRDQLDWSAPNVEGKDFAAVCSSATCTLGILPAVARGASTYASDRMWMTILAGGYYLGPETPGIGAMLIGGQHCAWYTSVDDCRKQVKHAVRHPAETARIRAGGERFVREHHTYDARVPLLLSDREWVNPL
jgi:hypothetical protein